MPRNRSVSPPVEGGSPSSRQSYDAELQRAFEYGLGYGVGLGLGLQSSKSSSVAAEEEDEDSRKADRVERKKREGRDVGSVAGLEREGDMEEVSI